MSLLVVSRRMMADLAAWRAGCTATSLVPRGDAPSVFPGRPRGAVGAGKGGAGRGLPGLGGRAGVSPAARRCLRARRRGLRCGDFRSARSRGGLGRARLPAGLEARGPARPEAQGSGARGAVAEACQPASARVLRPEPGTSAVGARRRPGGGPASAVGSYFSPTRARPRRPFLSRLPAAPAAKRVGSPFNGPGRAGGGRSGRSAPGPGPQSGQTARRAPPPPHAQPGRAQALGTGWPRGSGAGLCTTGQGDTRRGADTGPGLEGGRPVPPGRRARCPRPGCVCIVSGQVSGAAPHAASSRETYLDFLPR